MKILKEILKLLALPFVYLAKYLYRRMLDVYGSTANFMSNTSEYWKTIAVGLTLFFCFDIFGRVFNLSTYPIGVYQKIPFAIVSVAIFIVVALFLLKALFPNMRSFIDKDDTYHFFNLQAWQKYLFSLAVFALLFWGMVTIASSL